MWITSLFFGIVLLKSTSTSSYVLSARSDFSSTTPSRSMSAQTPKSRGNELSHSVLTSKKARLNKDMTKLGTLTVPSVGIGTISWSGNLFPTQENLEIQSLVSTACNCNAAFFDTAERYGSHFKTAFGLGYGETEELTGALISAAHDNCQQQKHHQTSNFLRSNNELLLPPVVATKFTPTPWRTDAESVVKACEKSRRRLGVESIDLYQLHMPDIVQPLARLGNKWGQSKDKIYWDGLAECYHRGLVKNVGVCNYGPTLLTECQEALSKRGVPLASNQIAYSLIGRHNGAQETVDRCNEMGIKVIAFFPFAMGLLTGKYSSEMMGDTGEQLQATDESFISLTNSKKTKLELNDLNRYIYGDGKNIPKGGIMPLLQAIEHIAKKREKTVSQVALNYIMCKGVIPIPGSRTRAQALDNMEAMGWRLSSREVAILEEESDKLGFGFEGAGFKRTSEKFVGYGVEKWTLD